MEISFSTDRRLSQSAFRTSCVLLCFIKPILGNRYVRSRGLIVSEPRETHPRSKIADVLTLTCPPFDKLGCPDPHPLPYLRRWLHRSPPLPLRTDLKLLRWQPGACALAAPSSGQVQSSFANCREKLHSPLPKATLVCLKKKTPKEKASLHQRGRGPITGLSHFCCRNDTKPADGPVDPASGHNHMWQQLKLGQEIAESSLRDESTVTTNLAKIKNTQPHVSFFLSWGSKTQPNHWTKWMANTRLAT